jgi:hypothetical protein
MPEFNLDESITVLSRTPAALDVLLRGLTNVWVRSNEGRTKDGEDTWSPFDIVGHLIVGERTDWMARARTILKHGEARPFDPFDRFAQVKESQGKSLEQLLDEFARLRKENLAALKALNLQPQDLARRGMHPELGVVTPVRTSGDMGRSRPHASASDIPRDGASVSRSSRPVARLSGRVEVCRPQRSVGGGKLDCFRFARYTSKWTRKAALVRPGVESVHQVSKEDNNAQSAIRCGPAVPERRDSGGAGQGVEFIVVSGVGIGTKL